MGAFGAGPFSNDNALDWIDSFRKRKSLAALKKPLQSFTSGENGEEEIIACAEILAAINGYPCDDLDPDIEAWAEKQRAKLPPALLAQGLTAVTAILRQSELRSLWEESDSFAEWQAETEGLVDRLSRSARSGPSERRPPILEIYYERSGLDGRKVRLPSSCEALLKPDSNLGSVRMLVLRVTQDITPAEYARVAAVIETTPDIPLFLTDYPRKRGQKFDPSILKYFGGVRKLTLQAEGRWDASKLACLQDLEAIMLRICAAPKILSELCSLPDLNKVEFYESLPSCFEDLSTLAQFRSCEEFRILYGTKFGTDENAELDQIKATVGPLPDMTRSLKKLELNCLRLSDIGALQRWQDLRDLELSHCRVSPRNLDFSSLKSLSYLSLKDLRGLASLVLPANLAMLGVRNAGELMIRALPVMKKLRYLSIVRSHLEVVPDFSTFTQLRFLGLENPQATDLRSLVDSPIVSLDLTAPPAGQSIPPIASLRYLHIHEAVELPSMLELSACAALEEITVYFKFGDDRNFSLSLDHFAPLRDLRSLKKITLYVPGVGQAFETRLQEFLRLDPTYRPTWLHEIQVIEREVRQEVES